MTSSLYNFILQTEYPSQIDDYTLQFHPSDGAPQSVLLTSSLYNFILQTEYPIHSDWRIHSTISSFRRSTPVSQIDEFTLQLHPSDGVLHSDWRVHSTISSFRRSTPVTQIDEFTLQFHPLDGVSQSLRLTSSLYNFILQTEHLSHSDWRVHPTISSFRRSIPVTQIDEFTLQFHLSHGVPQSDWRVHSTISSFTRSTPVRLTSSLYNFILQTEHPSHSDWRSSFRRSTPVRLTNSLYNFILQSEYPSQSDWRVDSTDEVQPVRLTSWLYNFILQTKYPSQSDWPLQSDWRVHSTISSFRRSTPVRLTSSLYNFILQTEYPTQIDEFTLQFHPSDGVPQSDWRVYSTISSFRRNTPLRLTSSLYNFILQTEYPTQIDELTLQFHPSDGAPHSDWRVHSTISSFRRSTPLRLTSWLYNFILQTEYPTQIDEFTLQFHPSDGVPHSDWRVDSTISSFRRNTPVRLTSWLYNFILQTEYPTQIDEFTLQFHPSDGVPHSDWRVHSTISSFRCVATR